MKYLLSPDVKISVSDSDYSYLIFSENISITAALWSSYSLQSLKTCSSVYSPSSHSDVKST
jgi:hypothetical protein